MPCVIEEITADAAAILNGRRPDGIGAADGFCRSFSLLLRSETRDRQIADGMTEALGVETR